MVYVLFAEGFEEVEALFPVDVLRRAGVETKMVGVGGVSVCGAHGIKVECDTVIEDVSADGVEMVVLPGGLPGADNLRENVLVRKLITDAKEQKAYIAAICAAPRILGEFGLLTDRRATCYPGFEEYLFGARVTPLRVVRDGHIITAAGAGAAGEFALELASVLKGPEVAEKLRRQMIF